MVKVELQVPASVLAISGKTAGEFAEEARFLLAAKLFELGRLSSGQAAQLCGKSRVDFLVELERIGVSTIQTEPDELRAELGRG